jgi:NAD(P)H-hydrate epimerase
VRGIDQDAVERLGLPSLALMENAGRGAFELLRARFELDRVVLVGGPGQNGGDAWVVGRHLVCAGHLPRAVLVGARDKVRGDAAVNLGALEALGVPVAVATTRAELDAHLAGATAIVDGIFGTGLDRPIDGLFAEAVRAIEAARAPVLALDIPSGIDADTGAVLGVAVRADTTATFAAHKRGLHQHPGVDHAGHVALVSIGVPGATHAPVALFDPEDAAPILGARALDAHKGDAGRVFVFAGDEGKTGACALAGLGALRAGAGLVTLAPRRRALASIEQKVLELMTHAISDAPDAAIEEALSAASGVDAAVVGPGFGLDDAGRAILLALAARLPVPAVLDADALTALADLGLETLASAAGPRVLTPHPGEAARLLGTGTAEVRADRYGAARALAARAEHVVVLKGARTIVAAPDGRMHVCRRGTPALATGGTGDVLAGVVAAELVHAEPFEAASVAVVLHALAGELSAVTDRGLLAHEVADALPEAIARARTSR